MLDMVSYIKPHLYPYTCLLLPISYYYKIKLSPSARKDCTTTFRFCSSVVNVSCLNYLLAGTHCISKKEMPDKHLPGIE